MTDFTTVVTKRNGTEYHFPDCPKIARVSRRVVHKLLPLEMGTWITGPKGERIDPCPECIR